MARGIRVARNLLLLVVTSVLLPVASDIVSGGEAQNASEGSRQTSTPPESASRSSSQASRELSELLAELGTKADLPEARNEQPASVALVALVVRGLASLPVEEQYRFLKQWTLPEGARQSARLLAVLVPHDSPPAEFNAVRAKEIAKKGLISTADLLIDASRRAGKLDELADELLEAADLGIENAETLYLLVEIARGQGAEVADYIADRQAALPAKLTESRQTGRAYQPIEWEDYLLARACTTDPVLLMQGENLLRLLATFPHAWTNSNDTLITYAIRDHYDSVLARTGRSVPTGTQDPKLAHWHPVSHLDSIIHRLGWVPPRWTVEDETIRHIVGPEYDFLYFKYPLEGRFEFSFDTYNTPQILGSGSAGSISYGAYVAEPLTLGPSTNTWVVGIQDRAFMANPRELPAGTYRLTAKVEPGRVRFFANDVLFFEETDPGGISPWLALNAWRVFDATFWNLQLQGEPEIPREVRLTRADRLEGWISSFYLETQPWRTGNGRRKTSRSIMPAAAPEHAAWYAKDSVIYGRQRTEPLDREKILSTNYFTPDDLRDLSRIWQERTFPLQSRLYYHRPLRGGDTLSYEFLYEPEKTEVHPSLGRLTFLLEPDGVRLHWITDTPYDDPTGLPHDNVIDVPGDRRGPEKLPLKSGAWNRMTISLVGDTAVLNLNGTDIYQRELQKTNGRFFGLFHWKDRTAVEVRNIVLTGDWPEKLTSEMKANLLAKSSALEEGGR